MVITSFVTRHESVVALYEVFRRKLLYPIQQIGRQYSSGYDLSMPHSHSNSASYFARVRQ